MITGTDTQEGPSQDLRSRVLGAARAAPAPTRSQTQRRAVLLLVAAFAASLAVFWLVGGVRLGGLNEGALTQRPSGLVLATGIGTAVLAFLVAWLAFARGRSALGRPRAVLGGVALASPALLLLWKVAVSAQVPHMMDRWSERVGLRCLPLSLAIGVFPLVAFVLARRGSDPVHPVALGAALGAASGTLAASLVDLWCPVAYVPHLLLGHVLPLVLLTLAGALWGARSLAPR